MSSVAGSVSRLVRYPVKSMQGADRTSLDVGLDGALGDRDRALIDVETGRLMSAKRFSKLLMATADNSGIAMGDNEGFVAYDDPEVNRALSNWLGREVELRQKSSGVALSYEMTFEPPNDEAEYIPIDAPAGSFLDLAPLHVISRQTLDGCAVARPDLDWDIRRFRPNVVVDAPGLEPFGEDSWCGRHLRVGTTVLEPRQPSVRCAMPLRAQPGLGRQPALYSALEDLHANHLGIYVWVAEAGSISLGDEVSLVA